MKKKIFLIIISLMTIGLITAGYVEDNNLLATSSGGSGGTVYGRINISPGNLAVTDAGLRKGDTFYLNVKNFETGDKLGWRLVGADEGVSGVAVTVSAFSCDFLSETPTTVNTLYQDTSLPRVMKPIIDFMQIVDSEFLLERDLSNIEKIKHVGDTYLSDEWAKSGFYIAARDGGYTSGAKPYLPGSKLDYSWTTDNPNVPESERTFTSPYDVALKDLIPCSNCGYTYIDSHAGSDVPDIEDADGFWSYFNLFGVRVGSRSYSSKSYVRPAAHLYLSNIVFGVTSGTDSGIAKVEVFKLPDSYKNLESATEEMWNNGLKLRVYRASMQASLTDIKNQDSQTISKARNDEKIYLEAEANEGTNYTVSALIFDSNNSFKYYMPLEAAKGSGLYEMDLSDISAGEYNIGIVNEVYDENSSSPADSSKITNVLPLEIEDSSKLIAYNKAPQSGASNGKEYEFSKNVNEGQTVGKITVNSQGVMPISYTLESNEDNSYQNFEIDGLDSNHASSSTTLNVNIKSDAPDLVDGGLKAGTYKFCVSAVDANGDTTTVTSDSKVCTAFTVSKTDLTIAFDEPNSTKKSMTEAATSWKETASPSLTDGLKVSYTVSGDDSLISIDNDTGTITYKGNNTFGKVKIKATVDDDPDTKNDNYNSAEAEKEIVIYQEVDGSIDVDSNSSDAESPTFTTSDSNIKSNGIIGTIKGTQGTPDLVDGGTITYSYGLKEEVGDANSFSVDENTGVIKTKVDLEAKTYNITVTVSDKWSTKEIPISINVGVSSAEDLQFYENSSSDTVITTKSVKSTDTGLTVFAMVKESSNNNPVKYKIKDGSTNVIEVNESSGAITVHGIGTVIIVAEKQGAGGQANATAELTFTVTAGAQNFIYTDNAGNELSKSGNAYSAYSEQYAKGKTFQLYTAGNPTGSTVTYQLKAGSPADVISVDANGLVTVLNASISPSQIGRVIVEATSHDPSGNYDDKTIELPINITKANQTISFKEITYVSNGTGSVAPIINEQDISSNDGGVNVSDTSYYISVDTSITNNIAYTDDGITIHYDYSGENGIDISLHVEKEGNRNYEKAEADGTLHIMSPDENILATTNMGKIVYGDHFEIRSLQDDSSSTNVQYQFEVDNPTYISNPIVTGNKAEFEALKASGKTNITIKVTRTADGETPLSKTISVQVLPKPIEITIDDKEKLKGEQNPTLTYQDFRNQLVSWNGVQDVIQENDIKLSTTAKTDSNAGNYPIKGDSNTLDKIYSNYSFKFKESTLLIKEETVENNWYHLELNDGNNTVYTGNWTNKDINIISDHNEYINMSLDQSIRQPYQITINKEGEFNQSFWMKKDNGATTKEIQEIIRIDKTAPIVKEIKAKDSNNQLQNIIQQLSNGIYFKPGTSFEITTDDSKDNLKVSGTNEINYKIYKVYGSARQGDELIEEGKLTVINEMADITISETSGQYKVCLILTDNADNTNKESCHEVELKKEDVDVNNKENITDVKKDHLSDEEVFSIGGAVTGDDTNTMIYINLICLAMGVIGFLFYGKKQSFK